MHAVNVSVIAPVPFECKFWQDSNGWLCSGEPGGVTSIVGAEQIYKLRGISETDLLVLAHSVPRTEKQRALELFQATCKCGDPRG